MSTDQGQVHPEQQQHRKTRKRGHKKKSLLDTTSKDQSQTYPEQQESTTITEKKDESLVQEEAPINYNQPTWEDRVAEKLRGALQNCIKVPKLSADGTVKYHVIPTRSYWLKMILDDWGSNDDETIACMKAARQPQLYKIEVCGCHLGYGVILRDSMRSPILVLSRICETYVSPFYHELKGVYLGLKLAMKYKLSYFDFNCVSEDVAEYVMQSWGSKFRCSCPPREKPKNPRENYCVECSKSSLDEVGESKNADKILPLIDKIFNAASKFAREGYPDLLLSPIKLSSAKAVWHLANSRIDQEVRIDEIEEDEVLAELLYKEVYGHISEEEVMLQRRQLMLLKQQRKMQKQLKQLKL
ncbi:hypothetical protein MKX01_012473 [Papaver californicum]|nr:hypothetical protein MKX01_012473 [Papaver californicum]